MSASMAELHQLHINLDEQIKLRDNGPKKIQSRELAISKKQDEINAKKQEILACQKQADQLNLNSKTTEQKIRDSKAKLNAAATNVEFQILKNQVATESENSSKIDGEYLAVAAKIDELKAQLETLQKELETAKAVHSKTVAEVTAAEPAIKSSITTLEGAIKVAAECIPNEQREYYRRLTLKMGSHGFSPVEDGSCTECSTEVTPQNRLELRTGKVLVCKICGRFQYGVR